MRSLKESIPTKEELAAIKARQLEWAKGEYALDAELIHEDLPALVAAVERLTVVATESNAVCACLCPLNEHENYGEDGEGCGNPYHDCVRTSHAVANILAGKMKK